MIYIDNLTVEIEKKEILKNISFKVSAGQFVGIIGSNGSGKSTLIKSLYKILKPSSGKIYINEYNITSLSHKELARQVAVVGQFNKTDLDFYVKEFVMMGRYPHKKKYERINSEDYEIVENSLGIMNMHDYLYRKISDLSGGEKQRVVIARALAQQPRCLILDEPTNHMDIKHQLQLFKQLKKLPITIIMSIHDMSLAYNHCDHIIALEKGELLKKGTPAEVINTQTIKQLFDVNISLFQSDVQNKVAILFSEI
ncbi:ABC transporter ATP-binding protein [Arenibacter sp. M-2]|uniref:ABC transporter ATP-binding protein n=1 Tax=Arenibacter sp. M-2 TaxID=3053612 RepID=UPI00256FF338|nr:ABC transporter ATP-binding protein [Arenibacter sp. M-2]MDL5512467.1 ABC transporter ATP-binding protein [Arenibacter sp. M-2]